MTGSLDAQEERTEETNGISGRGGDQQLLSIHLPVTPHFTGFLSTSGENLRSGGKLSLLVCFDYELWVFGELPVCESIYRLVLFS